SIVLILDIKPEGYSNLGYFEAMWMSLMRTLDPGTMGEDRGWSFRILMLIVTSYGILMLSTFIGLMSNGIITKVNDLRKGRSKVLENGHTLILGWSSKIYTIISELVIANENQKDPVIVILANRDKVEMEDEVKNRLHSFKNTRLIFRSGNPIDINDLEIANPKNAKSIIALGSKSENSDAEIIKSILAITKNLNNSKPNFHIVAEIESKKNLEVAKMVGRNNVELILSDEFVSRILVQTSRQAGLSIVYTDLLDFDGDEIYFTEEPKLIGKTFLDAIFSYDKSAVIGLQQPDQKILLNPECDTEITPGTKVITISEDDDKVIYTGKNNEVNEEIMRDTKAPGVHHDNILILGWNHRANIIIRELASYSQSNASIQVVASLKNLEKTIDKLNNECENTNIVHKRANTADKHVLEGLDVKQYDHLIILSYQDKFDTQQADANTLITLLHLRNIAEEQGIKLNIVSEMLDAKNRELARVTEADDFIISDNMISLMLSQVSENKYLMQIFDQLFKSEGNEIYLKPVNGYVKTGGEVSFNTVLEAACRKGEIAIGYRMLEDAQDENENYGIVLNPQKSKPVRFKEDDLIIVLSED
ncbi:MAG: potassium transporter TrkA, partial [Bacteroidota bacterium]